jgi:cytochrome bd-type quinol oxidase subunit 2
VPARRLGDRTEPLHHLPGSDAADAAAPRSTLLFILWSTPPGMALLLPSLWYLFRVFKGEHMPLDSDRES